MFFSVCFGNSIRNGESLRFIHCDLNLKSELNEIDICLALIVFFSGLRRNVNGEE